MYNFHSIPIKLRLTLINTLISGVALLVGCITIFGYESVESRRSLIDEITTQAAILGDNVAAALSFNDASSAEKSLNSLGVDGNIDAAVVYDKDGKVFAVYRNPNSVEGAKFLPPPAVPNTHRFDDNSLQVFLDFSLAGEKAGTVLIQSDLEDVYARVWRYVVIAVLVIVGASILAFVLSARLLAPVSGPIAELSRVVGSVAASKNYSLRAVKRGDDEIGRLIGGFNDMLEQIQLHEVALKESRDGLERRVDERTVELKQEIAERKDAEASLKSSEERFAGAFENASIGMALVSPEGRWLRVNRALCELLGYTAAEMMAGSFQDITHPDDLAGDNEFVRRMLAGEIETYQMEKRYFHKLGDVIWILLSVSLVRDALGRPQHFISQIQDISQRKHALQAVADSETRLRALLENSSDVIAITAIDGRLMYVSPSIRKVGGYEPDELLGGNFLGLVHPDDQAAAAAQFTELIRFPEAVQRVERRYRRKDGSWIQADNIAVNLMQVPAIGGVVTTLRDITVRKRAEAELAQTHQKLLEASRLGGMAEVATNVLHNVGNVLNSVNVSASLLADNVKASRVASLARIVSLLREHRADLGGYITSDAKGQHIPAVLEQLSDDWQAQQQTLLKEVESLRANVDHIKEIVAMQQSYAKVSGIAEIVDIRDLVEDSLRMSEGGPDIGNVQVVREFEELPPISLERHKVLQILVNLVRNAKRACADAGGSEKCVTLRLAGAGGRVRMSVSDNGIGIAPENLTRIFAHGYTTRKDGHGFGLHSGALAASEMGGSLKAHSDGPGQGATFTLELPQSPPAVLPA